MNRKLPVILLLTVGSQLLIPGALAQDKAQGWSAEVESALQRSGDNRAELVKALSTTPAEHRKGMAFLIAHMPDADLKSLGADFLLGNVALAYQAVAQA